MESLATHLRFGPFVLDRETGELRRDGAPVHLRLQASRVLEALASEPGRTLSRSELRARVWDDGVFVDYEQGLNSCIKEIRAALGDRAEAPIYIETLPRRGYRFIAPVANGSPGRRRAGLRRASVVWTLLLVLAAVTTAALALWTRPEATRDASRPRDSRASEAYQKGLYLKERPNLDSLRAASRALSEAARLEPEFAPAAAALAEVHVRLALFGGTSAADLAAAQSAARQALEHHPDDALAHAALGAALHLAWDFEGAERHVRQALANGPELGRVHHYAAGYLASVGRFDEAIAASRRAVELEPESLSVVADLGVYQLMAGRYREAIEAARRSLELEPGFEPALWCLVRAHEALGQWDEARLAAGGLGADTSPVDAALAPPGDPRADLARLRERRLAQLEAEARSSQPNWYTLAALNAELGRADEALRWLRWAHSRREPFLVFAGTEPAFASLGARPGFASLLRSVGIPQPLTARRHEAPALLAGRASL